MAPVDTVLADCHCNRHVYPLSFQSWGGALHLGPEDRDIDVGACAANALVLRHLQHVQHVWGPLRPDPKLQGQAPSPNHLRGTQCIWGDASVAEDSSPSAGEHVYRDDG